MVRIAYRHITRIIDLIEEKLVQLENDKAADKKRANYLPYNPVVGNDKELAIDSSLSDMETEKATRFDKIIEDYTQLRDVLSSELDHIEFKLGIEEKWNHQNQPSQPNK